jgi:(R,R)-butanediol dehydrogenase / meso-butanediol dehydrogenase / diacetyl reductase
VVCGTCVSCSRGATNLCKNLAFHGFNTGTGGLAEFAVVRRDAVYTVPDSFTPRHAALVEPLSVAYHAVCRTDAAPGDTVVVHGAGPIGVGAFLMLRHRHNRVIVVEPSPQRRDNLHSLGADEVIDPTTTDAVATIREMTGGLGAVASIDAAGVAASFQTALATTAEQGRLVVAAVHKEPLELNGIVLFSELSITGSTTYCGDDYPSVIRAIEELAFPLDGWVEEIPLDAIVDRGFERLHRGEATKIMVQVSEG